MINLSDHKAEPELINMNTNEVIANRALERMGYEKVLMRKLAQTLM